MKNRELITLKINKEAGTILPQLLITAGVIGALSLGVMNMTQNVSRSQEGLESRYQMSLIEEQIRMGLRSRLGCRRSVGGTAVTADPGAQINTIRDGFGNETNAGRRIIGIDDILGRTLDAGGNKDTSAPEFTVTDIRVTTYADENGPVGAPDGTTTSFLTGFPETYDFGPAIVSVFFEKGDVTRAGNEGMQTQRSYGVQSFRRDFPIRVLVNAANEIADCYIDENNVVEEFCDSLEGIWGDGLCKEIEVEELNADAASVYAIKSEGSTLVQNQGFVVVGDFVGEPAPFPEDAHLYVENNADIEGNLDVGTTPVVPPALPNFLRVVGGPPSSETAIEGSVGIGLGAPTANLRLDIAPGGGNDGVIVNRNGDSVVILNNAGESVMINNTNADPALIINTTSTTQGMIEEAGTPRFEVMSDGSMKINNPGPDGTTSLEVGGSSGTTYFPAYIRNQPTSVNSAAAYSTNWDVSGARGEEIATKRWAGSSLYAHLNVTGSEAIFFGNVMSTYQGNNQLQAIERNICESFALVSNLGGGSSPSTPTGNFVAGVCSFETRHCHNGGRCGNLYTTGVHSTGDISTTGTVRVESGADDIVLRGAAFNNASNTRSIVAPDVITSNTLVRAPKIHATGTAASSGICASDGCANRFGWDLCPVDSVAVGMNYGKVMCGNPDVARKSYEMGMP